MGLERNGAGDFPQVAASAFVHPSAILIGNVRVGERVFIGPNAVIRADESLPGEPVEPVVIEDEANIQDAVVIHALGGSGVRIGRATSIAHSAVVHGPCDLGQGCFVGFNSVVFRSTVADGSVILHQSLLDGVDLPKPVSVPSMTAVLNADDVAALKPVPDNETAFAAKVVEANLIHVEEGKKKGYRDVTRRGG